MKDLKIPFLIAVPAAVTILGIVWFLRRTSGHDKDGKKTKKTKSLPSADKTFLKTEDKQTPSHPSCVEKEGITLTQRKIPEAANSVAGHVSGNFNQMPLTDSEREKVQEIVEAAIGAGLKEAKSEFAKGATTSVNEEPVEVQEQMMAQSVASVQSMNIRDIGCYNANTNSKPVKGTDKNFYGQGNYTDNNVIAELLKREQTTPSSSSNVPIHSSSSSSSANVDSATISNDSFSSSFHSPLSTQEESHSNSQPSRNAVPSKPTSTIQPEAIVAASSTSVDLGSSSLSSSLPSNNASKDSGLETSVTSDIKLENTSFVSPDMTNSSAVLGKIEESASSTNSTSPVCDNNSVGSNDSGRGGSEQDSTCQNTETLVHLNFNMPSELCGRLIGRKGHNINQIKAKSGASVSLTNNPVTAEFQICQVVGSQAEVDEALAIIRHKFPLAENPHLTMTPIALNLPKQIESASVLVPDNMQLSLPDGASVEVYVSTIVDAGHVFVQQPTHRSFMCLEKLNYFLNSVYGQDDSIPSLPVPIECGVICVCENEGSWYRAMVMTPEDEFGECQVKFVDYGGYTQLPISCIKQIRADFMNLPFQAVECFVANIAPLQEEEYFSTESTMALSEMSQMKLLQCQVVARNEIGTPYIHLYLVNPDNNTATLVNRALVNNGLVRWMEIL